LLIKEEVMIKQRSICASLLFLMSSSVLAYSSHAKPSNLILQAGGFWASQGKAQNIGINTLIGDRFTVTQHHDENALLGVGYYLTGLQRDRYSLMYGANFYYFPHTQVKGNVIQEQLFTNLSYRYSLTHYPLYAGIKLLSKSCSNAYNFTFDAGIGANFVRTGHFSEKSLDGVTLPDNAFKGRTTTVFSWNAGVGMRFNHILKHLPVELSYRYFNLGEAKFNRRTDQLLNTLKTGNNTANALILSVYF
jgi:opacity protein-like surface antigen